MPADSSVRAGALSGGEPLPAAYSGSSTERGAWETVREDDVASVPLAAEALDYTSRNWGYASTGGRTTDELLKLLISALKDAQHGSEWFIEEASGEQDGPQAGARRLPVRPPWMIGGSGAGVFFVGVCLTAAQAASSPLMFSVTVDHGTTRAVSGRQLAAAIYKLMSSDSQLYMLDSVLLISSEGVPEQLAREFADRLMDLAGRKLRVHAPTSGVVIEPGDGQDRAPAVLVRGGGHWALVGRDLPEDDDRIVRELADASGLSFRYAGHAAEDAAAETSIPLSDRRQTMRLVEWAAGMIRSGEAHGAESPLSDRSLGTRHQRPDIVRRAAVRYLAGNAALARSIRPELVAAAFPWLKSVNPYWADSDGLIDERSATRVSSAIAVNESLAWGRGHLAEPLGRHGGQSLHAYAGDRRMSVLSDWQTAATVMATAPSWARAVVATWGSGTILDLGYDDYAFNVVHHPDLGVIFLDGWRGQEAELSVLRGPVDFIPLTGDIPQPSAADLAGGTGEAEITPHEKLRMRRYGLPRDVYDHRVADTELVRRLERNESDGLPPPVTDERNLLALTESLASRIADDLEREPTVLRLEYLSGLYRGHAWVDGEDRFDLVLRAALRRVLSISRHGEVGRRIKIVEDARFDGASTQVVAVPEEVWRLLGGVPGEPSEAGRPVIRASLPREFDPRVTLESSGALTGAVRVQLNWVARWLAEAVAASPQGVSLPTLEFIGKGPTRSAAKAWAVELHAEATRLVRKFLQSLNEDPALSEILLPRREADGVAEPGRQEAGASLRVLDQGQTQRVAAWGPRPDDPRITQIMPWLPQLNPEALREGGVPRSGLDQQAVAQLGRSRSANDLVEQTLADVFTILRASGKGARGIAHINGVFHNAAHTPLGPVILDGSSGRVLVPVDNGESAFALVEEGSFGLEAGARARLIAAVRRAIVSARSESGRAADASEVSDSEIIQAYLLHKDEREMSGRTADGQARYLASRVINRQRRQRALDPEWGRMPRRAITARAADSRRVSQLAKYADRALETVPPERALEVTLIRETRNRLRDSFMDTSNATMLKLNDVWKPIAQYRDRSTLFRAALQGWQLPPRSGEMLVRDAWETVNMIAPPVELWQVLGARPGPSQTVGRDTVSRINAGYPGDRNSMLAASTGTAFDSRLVARWLAETAGATPEGTRFPYITLEGRHPDGRLALGRAKRLREVTRSLVEGFLGDLGMPTDIAEQLVPGFGVSGVSTSVPTNVRVSVKDPDAALRGAPGSMPADTALLKGLNPWVGWLAELNRGREQRGSWILAARVDRALRTYTPPERMNLGEALHNMQRRGLTGEALSASLHRAYERRQDSGDGGFESEVARLARHDEETRFRAALEDFTLLRKQLVDAMSGSLAVDYPVIDDVLAVVRNSGPGARGLIQQNVDGLDIVFNIFYGGHDLGVVILDGFDGRHVLPGELVARRLWLTILEYGADTPRPAFESGDNDRRSSIQITRDVSAELGRLGFSKAVDRDEIMQTYLMLKHRPWSGPNSANEHVNAVARYIADDRRHLDLPTGATIEPANPEPKVVLRLLDILGTDEIAELHNMFVGNARNSEAARERLGDLIIEAFRRKLGSFNAADRRPVVLIVPNMTGWDPATVNYVVRELQRMVIVKEPGGSELARMCI